MHKAELNRSNRKHNVTVRSVSRTLCLILHPLYLLLFTSALPCLLPLSPSRLGRQGAGGEDARFVEVSVRTPLYVGYKFGTTG